MGEPDVINEHTECRDCDGTGEQEYAQPGFSCDIEQSFAVEDCQTCGGSGYARLADLSVAR